MTKQAEALARTADTLLEHTRPYVICYLKEEGGMIRAVLENVGSRPAQSVVLEYDPPLEELADTRFSQAPVRRQSFIAPGQRFFVLVTTSLNALHHANEEVRTDEVELRTDCTANYEDLDGRKFQERFIVSHGVARRAIQQPLSVPYVLKEIQNQMSSIAKTIMSLNEKIPKKR